MVLPRKPVAPCAILTLTLARDVELAHRRNSPFDRFRMKVLVGAWHVTTRLEHTVRKPYWLA
jgi:hypothetical protein